MFSHVEAGVVDLGRRSTDVGCHRHHVVPRVQPLARLSPTMLAVIIWQRWCSPGLSTVRLGFSSCLCWTFWGGSHCTAASSLFTHSKCVLSPSTSHLPCCHHPAPSHHHLPLMVQEPPGWSPGFSSCPFIHSPFGSNREPLFKHESSHSWTQSPLRPSHHTWVT